MRKYITALLFILCSCNDSSSEKKYNPDVQEIIITNIIETIGHGDSAKMAYRFPPVDSINDTHYKHYYDSIKHMLDTDSCYITLIDPAYVHTDFPDEKSLISQFTDVLYGSPGEKVSFDTTIKISFDSKQIAASVGLPVRITTRIVDQKDIFRIAVFSFSRLLVNGSHTKAMIFQNYSCGGLCGYGEWRGLEKKSGKWVVIRKQRTWIS